MLVLFEVFFGGDFLFNIDSKLLRLLSESGVLLLKVRVFRFRVLVKPVCIIIVFDHFGSVSLVSSQGSIDLIEAVNLSRVFAPNFEDDLIKKLLDFVFIVVLEG